MMRTMRLLVVLVVAAAAVAAAAGASGKEPRKVIKPAAQARAKRIAVHLSDLPGSGWKAEPSKPDQSNPHCSYYDPDESKLTENGDYTSPDFTRPDGTYASSTVGVFVSAKQAKTAFAAVVRPLLPRCLGQIVAGSGKPGEITVGSAGTLAFPRFGDRSAAFRVVFSVRSGTTRVRATIDIVAVNRGAVDAAVFFGGLGGGVSPSLEHSVVGAVTRRIGR